ncbi:GtrA family protein [Rhizobium sp. CSW-27]|uniref:GtrA family protein n=1 Tax=Rhizobium sp. CSW-27 TaxID=2839985 RepID=UPI001C023A6E|nr:GtrA family protein [Rhizobium sp. CSW-27]MBT9371471.1 GtrA family protein [Rhizobium sp. CSW-27]
MISRLLQSSLLRFGMVAVIGLGVDLGTAWTLSAKAGLPLTLSAFAGFACGAVMNYLMHEFWTFRDASSAVSVRRGVLYLVAVGVTLVARLAAVMALQPLFGAVGQGLVVLVGATAFSFVVNYIVSRHLVFARAGAAPVKAPHHD